MDRYEKLSERVFGLDLHYGKITPKQGHNSVFYYIVENTDDEEFIAAEALKMITGFGQTYYIFYGKYESRWHIAFDEADIKVFGIDNDVAMTIGYDSLEDMAENIRMEMHVRAFIPTDIYIIYDDKSLYEKLKKLLEV